MAVKHQSEKPGQRWKEAPHHSDCSFHEDAGAQPSSTCCLISDPPGISTHPCFLNCVLHQGALSMPHRQNIKENEHISVSDTMVEYLCVETKGLRMKWGSGTAPLKPVYKDERHKEMDI